jgi:tape measure domain-containing protein
MAKVLGFTIEIQGQQKVIDTTNQLKEALKQIKAEMGKTSDAKDYEKLAKEAAKLTNELTNVNKQQREYNKELQNSKAAAGSYNALNAELVKLRQSYKALSEAERNSVAGRDALKRIGELDTQLKKLDAGMGNFQRNVGNYPQTILGLFSQLSPAIGNVTNAISSLGSASGIAGKALVGGFAVATLIPQLVSAAAATEQYRTSFQTLSGSVAEGNKLFENLIEFAKSTPFELPQLQDAAKSLTAFGFDTQGVMDTLQTLGDIAAGVGQDKLPQLVAALGKVRAGTRLTGETLQSFTDAGVPLLQTLADRAGVSARQMQKSISEGRVSFEETQAALASMTQAGGKFFGMMEQQSKTTAGQISNFKDSIGQLASNLGGLLLPAVNAIVGGLGQIVSSITNMISPTKSAVENTADLQTQFNIEVETLKRANLSQENRKALIDGINERYKTYLPSLITEKDTIEQIGIKQAEANKAFEQKMILLAAEKSFVDINQKRLDAQKQELELAKNLSAEQQKFAEATERTRKRGTFDRNETGAFLDLQASEALIKAQQNVQGNKALQEQLRVEYEKTAAAAQKLGLDLSKLTGGGTTTTTTTTTPDDKGRAKREAAEKAANEAILREREAFEKQLRELVNTARDLTIGMIEDKYKREAEIAQKQRDDQLQKLREQRAKLVEEQRQTEEKILESQKAGNKEAAQQLANFRIESDRQRQSFDANAAKVKEASDAELAKKLVDIEKQKAKDIQEINDKADAEALKSLNELFRNQEKIRNTANTTEINDLDDKYQKILDNENLTNKERLRINKEYYDQRFALQQKALQDQINLLEQEAVALEGSDPNGVIAAKEKIAELKKQLAASLKEQDKFNKNNKKEIVKTDKEIQEQKVKNAIDAMNVIKDFASTIGNFIDELNQRQIARMEEQISAHQDKLGQLQEEMSNTTGAQRVELQRQIDNEKAALDQATQQKAEAEKKAAKEHQRIALIQAIIDTASAIIANAVKNPFAAVAAGILGGVQIATIAAQAFADGGKVLSGEKIRNKPNIRMRNGDNVLATVRTGEVILNERQQARLGGAKTFRRIGVPGFASGGMVGDVLPRPTEDFLQNATQSIQTNNEIKALVKAMDARFDRLQVHVVGEDVANELTNQARAKKAAVI